MCKTRRWLIKAAVILAVAICVFAARMLILSGLGLWLDVGGRPHKADFILILTGEENHRPFLAAALLRAGYADNALLPQGYISSEVRAGIVPPAGEIIRRVLISQGVAPENIIALPDTVESTFDEAQALANFLREKPNARVLIVTSHYHSRRAQWIFSKILGDPRKISMVSAPLDDYQLTTWWRNARGFTDVIEEYLKLTYYLIRYGSGSYYLAGGLCLAIMIVIFRCRRRKKYPSESAAQAKSGEVMA